MVRLVLALLTIVAISAVNAQGASSFLKTERAGGRVLASQAPATGNTHDATVPTGAGGPAVTDPMGRKLLQGGNGGQARTDPSGRTLKASIVSVAAGEPVSACLVCVRGRKLLGATTGVMTPTVADSTPGGAVGRRLHGVTAGEPTRKLAGATAGTMTSTTAQSTQGGTVGRKLRGATAGTMTSTTAQSTPGGAVGRKLRSGTVGTPASSCTVCVGKRKLQEAAPHGQHA